MSVRLEEIDPRYVELEAQRREIAWRRGAAPRELERRQRRAAATLGVRLDDALRGLTLASTAPAAALQPRISSSPSSSGPPPRAEIPRAVAQHVTLLEARLEVLERELDAYRGLAAPGDLARLSTDAKNAYIVVAFVGVAAVEVAADFPELGSARTIERVRVEAGLRPSTGEVSR
jgi:hypothetical protein